MIAIHTTSKPCLPQQHRLERIRHMLAVGLGLCLLASGSAWADSQLVDELKQMSLLELMELDVTSVSRKQEKFRDTAAAVEVITAEDIRRSGATSLPELLRLAPGVEVARVDAHQWAVSVRGFNDVFANKLLVLMDGRSVYTPLFSGVNWDVQDAMLEDLARIEVIRGPGAAVWGANAVNGVINIISKPAADTQGWLLTGSTGTEIPGLGGVRYGGKLGENVAYRVYGKYVARDDSVLWGGGDANDHWQTARGGFRLDWAATVDDQLTLQGDVYHGHEHETVTAASLVFPFSQQRSGSPDLFGGNVLGRWQHVIGAESDWQLQAYYDYSRRDATLLEDSRGTFDLELQHRFRWGERQEIVWGGNYRVTSDWTRGSSSILFVPRERTTHLLGAFVQDEIELVRNRVWLTLGSKFEHNDFTGLELQPNARLLFKLNPQHSVWTALARAVRTPSRAEDDVVVNQPGVPPGFAPLTGRRVFESEELTAWEAGYRALVSKQVTVDVAVFYNLYDRLRTLEPPPAFPGPVLAGNRLQGETYGGELVLRWQPLDWWSWVAQYSWLEMQLHREPGSGDTTAELAEKNSPQHQVALRSELNLPAGWELDAALRYVDQLQNLNVPAYLTLDLRLGWRPNANWEFAVVGRNLLSPHHREFAPSLFATQKTEVERSVHGQVTWRF